MDCPLCGKEMRRGQAAYVPTGGLYFLPPAVCVTVLHDAAVGAPVFLTKNGHGRYEILDMQDFEKTQATIRLMNELAKGRSENLSLTGLVLTVYHSLVHYF